MVIEKIEVDEIALPRRFGVPFEFQGIFSGQALSGITLTLSNLGIRDQKIIEELIQKPSVFVKDPFVERSYDATIFQKSHSYTIGEDVKSYVLELNERDVLPEFSMITLNGNTFHVHFYEEYITEGVIGRKAILRLDRNEFEVLRKLLSEKTVNFIRVGVDAAPLELRFGGAMYWSPHNEGDVTFYKHIIRLFPLDMEPSKLNLASGTTQSVAVMMLVELHSKFRLLVEALGKNKILSEELQSALSGSQWKDLCDKEFILSLQDEFERVDEAEEHF